MNNNSNLVNSIPDFNAISLKIFVSSKNFFRLFFILSMVLLLVSSCEKKEKIYSVTYQISFLTLDKGRVFVSYQDSSGRHVSICIEENWTKQINISTAKSPDVIGSIAAVTTVSLDSCGFFHDDSKIKIKVLIACDKEVIQESGQAIMLALVK